MAIQAGHYVKESSLEELTTAARTALRGRKTFHWPLEFPEVILVRGGFDAFVCNPPFMGGKKISGNLGDRNRTYLVEHVAGGRAGNADLCSYFFLRAAALIRPGGQFGFIATNSVAQGETEQVGLAQLTSNGFVIPKVGTELEQSSTTIFSRGLRNSFCRNG